MEQNIITKKGRLQNKFLPAIYFDTSVVIDYWLAQSYTLDLIRENPVKTDIDKKMSDAIKDVLKVRDLKKMATIKDKVLGPNPSVKAVVSTLSFIEFTGWFTETTFKDIAASVLGTGVIQKKSKKDIGNLIKKTILEHFKIKDVKDETKRSYKASGLDMLMGEIFVNDIHFFKNQGLKGLLITDIANLNIPLDKELLFYAELQIGLADILHLITAKHLGCKYFASFDSDFKTVFKLYKHLTGLELLSNPSEIIKVLS